MNRQGLVSYFGIYPIDLGKAELLVSKGYVNSKSIDI